MLVKFEVKWIAWEITRRCNLNCVHCRSSSELEAKEHPDFSLVEAKKVLDDIGSFAQPVIVLSGGEPLLRNDVIDMGVGVHIVQSNRCCVVISSTSPVTDQTKACACVLLPTAPW